MPDAIRAPAPPGELPRRRIRRLIGGIRSRLRDGRGSRRLDRGAVERQSSLDWDREWRALAAIVAVFLGFYYLPVGSVRFDAAVHESLALTRWYAREHVLLCLVPAFFIAGAISTFVRREAVLRYLGPKAAKGTAYGVASISGSLLAVCSCTVLPLFAGIYRTGAGLGPAAAFLYSGPAINVLAIILTARILGLQIGLARAVGAVAFAIVVGLAMAGLFRREEGERSAAFMTASPEGDEARPLSQSALFFLALVGVLVFANWGAPQSGSGLWASIHAFKWAITAGFGVLLALTLTAWFGMPRWKAMTLLAATGLAALAAPDHPQAAFGVATVALSLLAATDEGELGEWFAASWGFAKQIMPLLLVGILIAGLLVGRPGHEGLVPSGWVAAAVGGNSLAANLIASVAGALMYFATLTEVPILQGLIGSGMGQGPALALLLAGPALSLPSILVVRSVLGWRKTLTYVTLVALAAAVTGILFGLIG